TWLVRRLKMLQARLKLLYSPEPYRVCRKSWLRCEYYGNEKFRTCSEMSGRSFGVYCELSEILIVNDLVLKRGLDLAFPFTAEGFCQQSFSSCTGTGCVEQRQLRHLISIFPNLCRAQRLLGASEEHLGFS